MDLRIARKIETDVLVVGGGGAACTAAVAAARSGAKTVIASKGKIGNSGDIIMVGGSFGMDGESACHDYRIEGADPSFTRADLFRSVVNDGFYLSDQNMVEQFVMESPRIVDEVRRWGEESGLYYRFYKPSMWDVSGRTLGRSLKKGVDMAPGVEMYEDVAIVELLKSGGRVTGALGIDLYRGELLEFEAKETILASGGFQPFALKNTNSDMTGDGQAMAYRAGARLADMEFLLYLITAIEPNELRGSILPVIMLFRQTFDYDPLDAGGNRIEVPKKLRDMEKTSELCKLVHIYYYGKAISEGRGTKNGGFYFDFSRFTDEEIDAMFEEVMDHFDGFYKRGFYHGDNVLEFRKYVKEKRRIEVGLGNEYTLGGILVNENMETDLEGLLAAGECASGVFGADRVADAVTEAVCQGYKAGETAGRKAKGGRRLAASPESRDRAMERIAMHFGVPDQGVPATNAGAVAAAKRLEEISEKTLGYYRDEESLKAGIAAYENLERELLRMTVKDQSLVYNMELLTALQTENRLLCSRLAAKMALSRRESRGLHLRSDYPYIDNERYLARSIAAREGGEDRLSFRKPIVTKIPLPEAKKVDYEEYLMSDGMGMANMEGTR